MTKAWKVVRSGSKPLLTPPLLTPPPRHPPKGSQSERFPYWRANAGPTPPGNSVGQAGVVRLACIPGNITRPPAEAAVWCCCLYKPVTISVTEARAARFAFNHVRRRGRRDASRPCRCGPLSAHSARVAAQNHPFAREILLSRARFSFCARNPALRCFGKHGPGPSFLSRTIFLLSSSPNRERRQHGLPGFPKQGARSPPPRGASRLRRLYA